MSGAQVGLAEALEITSTPDGWQTRVPEGYDVFGIPHGGFLAALGAQAVLHGSGAPDIFSITIHYLKKGAVGPILWSTSEVGGSRRFTSVRAEGRQGDRVVLAVNALVGDRSSITGPTWTATSPWEPSEARLSPVAGTPEANVPGPAIGERLGVRIDEATLGFVKGEQGSEARMRATVEVDAPNQLTALIACDITPPAVWNALGLSGWVPTVELTAHVRGRPAPGPLGIDVVTRNVAEGFLEEDAEVRDVEGRLIVQSRQLARYSEGPFREREPLQST